MFNFKLESVFRYQAKVFHSKHVEWLKLVWFKLIYFAYITVIQIRFLHRLYLLSVFSEKEAEQMFPTWDPLINVIVKRLQFNNPLIIFSIGFPISSILWHDRFLTFSMYRTQKVFIHNILNMIDIWRQHELSISDLLQYNTNSDIKNRWKGAAKEVRFVDNAFANASIRLKFMIFFNIVQVLDYWLNVYFGKLSKYLQNIYNYNPQL